ncbi:hypothetical protein [Mobilicoccus pelagius]|uniref:DUF2029 domain-containing protein n=1 Tax=Mobilicoccus pelagius NBRC 104925 TaxID=1089455 RepID=H5UT01_9MICO|nr:hypothetical protein [Mobilicoccus pelagius]GAB48859.1 hypothetical protein MOPEL_083_00640 [Mobilicoccus pelagius NBRC 104925]
MASIVTPPPDPADPEDPVARLATGVVGGPRGRYAAPLPSGPYRLVLAGALSFGACVTLLLGFLQKSYCVRYGWGAPQVYHKACYSDLPSFAGSVGGGGLPYDAGSALAEPLGVGAVLRLLSVVVPAAGFERQQGMFVAWAITAALLLVATVVATVFTCRTRPVRAAHVAFAPVVATAALVSLDLVGVALTAVALWLWSRERLTPAGIVLGLAIVTRTYPLLVLVVLALLALRAGALRAWARTAGVAVVTAVLLLVAAAVVHGRGVLTPYQVWLGAEAQLGSPWYLGTLADRPVPLGVLTLLTMIGWLLAVGAGALLTLAAPVRPRIGEIVIVVLVLVLLTGKSLPPQSSLWLVPFVALAGLRWRDHLMWAATEVCYFVAVWLYLGGLDDVTAALPESWYAVFLVLRLGGLLWLGAAAARQAMRRPAHTALDLAVHRDDDDTAGPMTGRRDAVVVRYAH